MSAHPGHGSRTSPLSPPGDGPLGGRHAGPWTLLLLAALASCAPGPTIPGWVPPPPDPFLRAPYVQAVTESTAVVLWQVAGGEDGAVRYRAGDGPWRGVPTARAGRIRRAFLRGLPAGREVDYVVETDGTSVGPLTFRTPGGRARDTVRVLAFGDSGYGSEAQVRLARRMEARPWDLAIHVGDVAYDDGSEDAFTERHFRVYRELLGRVPLFPVPGNHDVESAGGAHYDRAFEWPDGEKGRRYYSFRWNGVRFVALDTSTPDARRSLISSDGHQRRWLRSLLDSSRDDTAVRWLLVYAHHPLFSHGTGLSAHGPERKLRESLSPLFERYGVDLVLAGHEHHYERTRPILAGRSVARGCGPVYLITGGGGGAQTFRGVDPSGPLVARATVDHHFVELRVLPERIDGRAVGLEGTVLDRFAVRPYEPDRAAQECPPNR